MVGPRARTGSAGIRRTIGTAPSPHRHTRVNRSGGQGTLRARIGVLAQQLTRTGTALQIGAGARHGPVSIDRPAASRTPSMIRAPGPGNPRCSDTTRGSGVSSARTGTADACRRSSTTTAAGSPRSPLPPARRPVRPGTPSGDPLLDAVDRHPIDRDRAPSQLVAALGGQPLRPARGAAVPSRHGLEGPRRSGARSAVAVVERRVEVRVPVPPARRDWAALLNELARQLEDGRVHDRDLAALTAALRTVLDACSRPPCA